ncbi:hypothetical protein AALP_AA2G083600 [Arabis alpina]|uniref:Uncharacterized protein n=1 Tax=Arabis alpina TaxID=50452 RepID=A0A087HG31_ARAAL|nr:hypothetical protein AALP_AA2G083600 [Arabis alpina]
MEEQSVDGIFGLEPDGRGDPMPMNQSDADVDKSTSGPVTDIPMTRGGGDTDSKVSVFQTENPTSSMGPDDPRVTRCHDETRLKSSLPAVSKKFVTAMHDEAALEAVEVAKSMRSSGTDAPRAMVPMTMTPTATSVLARSSRSLTPKTPATPTLLLPPSLTPYELVMRQRREPRLSSGKGKGIDYETPSKRQRVDTHPGLLLKESELRVAKEANAVLQSRLDELTEQNLVLERDAFSVEKIKKNCDARLVKLKLRCTKGEDEIASLKTQFSSASDLQSTRIGEAVAEAKDEMAYRFAGRIREVAGLLAETGGKAQNSMLNRAEDLLNSVRGVLKIPEVSAAAVESVAVDDLEVDDEVDDEAHEES